MESKHSPPLRSESIPLIFPARHHETSSSSSSSSETTTTTLNIQMKQLSNTTPILNVLGLINETSPDNSSSIFEASLDLSPDRLNFIFNSFEANNGGKNISYDDLKKGIQLWQDVHFNEAGLTELAEFLDKDQSGDISQDEFANGLRIIALQRLFRSHLPNGSPITVLDYNSIKLETTIIRTLEEHHDFHTRERPHYVKNRWIDTVMQSDSPAGGALTLQRLAVKYHLHPLAVEDALEDNHRPKVEQYSTHYAVFLPIMSLVEEEEDEEEEDEDGGRRTSEGIGSADFWQNKCSGGGCCCCRRRGRGRDSSMRSIPRTSVDMVTIFVNVPYNDTLITFRKSGQQRGDDTNDMWKRVQNNLNKVYSKLRQYDSQYLLYGMLDAAVRDYFFFISPPFCLDILPVLYCLLLHITFDTSAF